LGLGARPDGFGCDLVHNVAATTIELVLSNAAPTIGVLDDLTTPEDVSAGPVAFSVFDTETPASLLELTVTSSDPVLVPTANITIEQGAWATGSISRSYWLGLSGTAITDLTSAAAFPDHPSGSDERTLFETPSSWADNYGQLVRGYIIAPQTGNYTFWIASDDRSELWLSSDDDPSRKTKIAQVNSYTGSRQWTKEAGQQSDPIWLEAGHGYYIEAIHKEGGGGDHLAVGWQLPDSTYERPIPGHRLAPFFVPSERMLTITPAADQFGTATISVTARDRAGATTTRTFQLTVSPVPDTFTVRQFVPTPTGFLARFDRDFNPSVLNLYDSAGLPGPADAVLQGAAHGIIRGSLLIASDLQQITFIKTAGVLEPDTYNVTLYSGTTRFVGADGNPLDGNGDETAGDDYITTFIVAAPPSDAVVVGIPDFSRGPGQAVNVPADRSDGIPLTLSDGTGIQTVDLRMHYEPGLLGIGGASVGDGMPVGSEVTLTDEAPGVIRLQFQSPTPLSAGMQVFVNLQAAVPVDAIYTDKHLLDLRDISINAGSIPAIDDDGIHVVAYFGDVTGNGTYSSLDTSRISRMAVGLDTGFAAFPSADPVLVGDITGNGGFSSLDTSRI
ncbi:MAG: PA14 domain-containing protein, partial [Planctomycetes bacterium]|nr:PA14 domain-containing protein [Planctomycetota bacterium]